MHEKRRNCQIPAASSDACSEFPGEIPQFGFHQNIGKGTPSSIGRGGIARQGNTVTPRILLSVSVVPECSSNRICLTGASV